MQNTFEYISINEVLSRIMRHPLLQDVNKETAIQYVVDFIGIVGLGQMYDIREDVVDICQYKGVIPCPVISINGVKKIPENISLIGMTDIYYPNRGHRCHPNKDMYTYKCQNRIIHVGFEAGQVLMNYNTIKVDEDMVPMILDEPNYLKALEEYIKLQVFTIKFDTGEISQAVLQNTQQQYAWAVGRLNSTYKIPDVSEMESIKNMWCTLVQRTTDHIRGFRYLENMELIRNH